MNDLEPHELLVDLLYFGLSMHMQIFNSAYWIILHVFLSSAVFFKINIFKKSSRNTIRVSISLDPDQARHFVEPDLGLNCLQKNQQTTQVSKELNRESQAGFWEFRTQHPALTWVNVFRINPEFRILRLTFHRKSASKCWIEQIIKASLIYFQYVLSGLTI